MEKYLINWFHISYIYILNHGGIMVDIYSKSPISEIIFKLTFSQSSDIQENISDFYDAIKDKFKFKGVKTEPKISINITQDKGNIKTIDEPSYWYFHNNEDLNNSPFIIEVGKDNCLIDFRANFGDYLGFDNFKEYIELLINASRVFKVNNFDSIGLRYINTIKCQKGNPTSWGNIISENILFDDLLKSYESPSRLMSEFTFKKNEFFIKFNFGIFNTEFPNPIARKEFILDFDCIHDKDTNISDVVEIVDKMHHTIRILFEENTTEEYLEFIR